MNGTRRRLRKWNTDKKVQELRQITSVISLDIMDKKKANSGLGEETFERMVPDGDFVQGDVEDLGFEDSVFDGILCWRVLHHLARPVKALKEFARVGKNGGLVFIRMPRHTGRTSDSSTDPWGIKILWNEAQLEEAARSVGLVPYSDSYVDKTDSQARLFKTSK